MRISRYTLPLLLLGYLHAHAGETWVYSRLTVNNGLASNEVKDVLCDRDGFVWAGTVLGLQRYDGNRFTGIRINNNAGFAPVGELQPDNHGNIWFKIKDTLLSCVERTAAGHQVSARHTKNLEHLNVLAYDCSMGDAMVIVTKNRQVYRYHLPTGRLTSFGYLRVTEGWLRMGQLPHNRLLLLTTRQAYIFELAEPATGPQLKPISQSSVAGNAVLAGFYLHKPTGQLYLFCRQLSKATTAVIPYNYEAIIHAGHRAGFINVRDINGCRYLNDSTALLYSALGLFRLQLPQGRLLPVYLKNAVEENAYNESIRNLFVDAEHNVWICPASGGLLLVNASQFAVTTYRLPIKNNSRPHIRSCALDSSGRLLLGIDMEGLFAVAPGMNPANPLQLQPVETGMVRVNSIYVHHNGAIIAGSDATAMRVYPDKVMLPALTATWCYTADSDGRIWAGTNGHGIFRLDDTAVSIFYQQPGVPRPFYASTDVVWRLAHWRNRLLAATDKGLMAYDKAAKKPTNDALSKVLWAETGADPFWGLLLYNDSIAFAGSVNKKLYQIELQAAAITTILGGNIIFFNILRDAKGCIWITTDRGVIRYNPRTNAAILYGVEDNLVSLNLGYLASMNLQGGKLLFAGMGGFSIIDPALLPLPDSVRPVITGLSVPGYDTFNRLPNDTLLRLQYNQHSFLASFATPGNLQNPATFYYQLENYDTAWHDAGNAATAAYSNLPPGRYRLQVKKAMPGVEQPIASLRIHIARAYWQTTGFRVGIVILTVLALALPLWLRYRYQRAKNRERMQVQELEVKTLRTQLNPHFVFNALNSIQYFIIKNDKAAANNYLSKFSALMRQVLQSSKQPLINVADEAGLLRRYLEIESLRFDGQITWEVIVDAALDPAARMPGMMIQPVVENAVVHGLMPRGGRGHITVLLKAEDGCIVCTVTDNGAGERPPQHTGHQSSGLALLRERIQLMNRMYKRQDSIELQYLYEQGLPCGALVTLHLPVIAP